MTTKSTIILACGLVWLGATQSAWCFYNPTTGRWLTRDPALEFNFRLVHEGSASRASRQAQQKDPYVFLDQDAINKADFLGLCICKGVFYNPFTACCCKGQILKSKRIKTGIRICHTPIQGYPYMSHTFLEVDGGFSAGFYPEGSIVGKGAVDIPDSASGEEAKSCMDYELSPCEHDINRIKECVKTQAQKNKEHPPDYIVGVFDCVSWAYGILNGCLMVNQRCAPYP